MERIVVSKGKRKISILAHKLSLLGMGWGLMFRSRGTKNLLFDFPYWGSHIIHSWFVFFPFLALWLDDKNRVMEWRIVKPFRYSVFPRKPFKKLVELPINAKNSKIIRFIVGK